MTTKATLAGQDEVFCDDGGLWVRDPRGNCRSFDIHDYEAIRDERDDLLSALKALNESILGRAESNASGNPEWEYVSSRINAARAAIAKAEGRRPLKMLVDADWLRRRVETDPGLDCEAGADQ